MIKSISYDQTEILSWIMELYCPNGFDVDPTFGRGGFYRDGRIPLPRFCSDMVPRFEHVLERDCRNLRITDRVFWSVLFDPPFIHAPGKKSIIGNRFSGYPRQRDLHGLYYRSLEEFHRILCPGGFVVFKCQDIVESGKQVWNHMIITVTAERVGFALKDLFVLAAKHRIEGKNHGKQRHARKFHSYFLVLVKDS